MCMVLCLMPIIVVTFGNLSLCATNWAVYGLPLRNDRCGNFAKAMRDIYLIAADTEQEARFVNEKRRCPILASTVEKACDASPTLGKIRMAIRTSMECWGHGFGVSGQPLGDHMLWAIRDAVSDTGYYRSLPESERFYGQVHRELSEAFALGILKRRGVSLSPLVAPFRTSQMQRIWAESKRAFCAAVCFKDIAVENPEPIGTDDQIRRVERISGDLALSPDRRALAEPFVRRANYVSLFYQHLAPVVFCIALIGYLFETIIVVRRKRALDSWLTATSSLIGVIMLSAMVGFVSATTFHAVKSLYLASAYLCVLMFCSAAATTFVSMFVERRELCERG